MEYASRQNGSSPHKINTLASSQRRESTDSRATTLLPVNQALTGTALRRYPARITVGFRLAYLLVRSARGSGRIFSLSRCPASHYFRVRCQQYGAYSFPSSPYWVQDVPNYAIETAHGQDFHPLVYWSTAHVWEIPLKRLTFS